MSKPNSLRDRIAAFENKGAQGPSTAPPPPRPKPTGLQWKPKAPSPPPASPESVSSTDRKPAIPGGMSVSDAMESIGRGGSLKERMAALQGKGAFGGPPPPPPVAPKPSVERPKWKPPPAVAAPEEDISNVNTSTREASRSPPPRVAASPTPEIQETAHREPDVVAQEGDGGDQDPEEEERQRRAAIAARMARLGGARFGMGPPIFAPKPVVRQSVPEPSADEVKQEDQADQPTDVKESSEALVTSPPEDSLGSVAPAPEAVAESDHRDEVEVPLQVPPRGPTSMPVPTGPRRAAPPRKKVSKNTPTAPLPEPPPEEAEIAAVQPPSVTHVPPPSAEDSHQEIEEVVETSEAAHGEHLTATSVTADVEHSAAVPTEAFREPVEEHDKQEAEEVYVESEGIRTEEEPEMTLIEQPSEPVDAEEDAEEEEARRQRVAARLAQMGAFNPLAGPPSIPQHPSSDDPPPVPSKEREPFDVEDEVNVDTEEYGETIPPPAVPARHNAIPSVEHDTAKHVEIDQDDVKVDEDDQVPVHRDGGHEVVSYTEDQRDGHAGHTSPEGQDDFVHPLAKQSHGKTTSTQQAESIDASDQVPHETEEPQAEYVQEDVSAPRTTSDLEHDTPNLRDDEVEPEMPPPRITRPIPPPPVNLRSKPTPPSSPPLSPPPRTPLSALRTEDEERPASPDTPPRPIPPPLRSSSMTEDAPSPPPRRSMPPPPKRMSVRLAEPLAETPSLPPPVPTSPRPINNRRQATPPIITTLTVQEPSTSESEEQEREQHVQEATSDGVVTPQPSEASPEDEASARRRAIAERMARLGGIRFGAPPLMDPLSRPPLPAAPPPTSIPPDETESEEKEEEGARRGEEEEEDEMARKQRIAARLAGMGGMRLGMLPLPGALPPRQVVAKPEESEGEDVVLPVPVPVPAPSQRSRPSRKAPPPVEAPLEQALKEQVESVSRRTSSSEEGVRVEAEESSEMERVLSAAPGEGEEAPTPPALPPSRRRPSSRTTPRSAATEVLPTPPPRVTSRSPPPSRRPPIPIIPAALLGRRSSTGGTSMSVSSSRQTSLDETPVAGRPPSEYVMVEAEDRQEEREEEDDVLSPVLPSATSPRRSWSMRGSAAPTRSAPLPPPPPPSAIDPPEAVALSTQWGDGSEIASSRWSEDSTAVHVPPPALSGKPLSLIGKMASLSSMTTLSMSGSGLGSGSLGSVGSGSGSGGVGSRRSIDQRQPVPAVLQQQALSMEDLMTIWGKVGVQVVEAATALFDKSKRTLVGDGTYAGFVRAVLAQVPGVWVPPATCGTESEDEWGYVVYAQTGSAVQRRVAEMMPGDVICFWDAKLKGHRGLHTYSRTVGESGSGGGDGGGPLVGIVSEFDAKKSKVRVWQANRHVGQQTVENVSYRLEDLKSGQVKVYRVILA